MLQNNALYGLSDACFAFLSTSSSIDLFLTMMTYLKICLEKLRYVDIFWTVKTDFLIGLLVPRGAGHIRRKAFAALF